MRIEQIKKNDLQFFAQHVSATLKETTKQLMISGMFQWRFAFLCWENGIVIDSFFIVVNPDNTKEAVLFYDMEKGNRTKMEIFSFISQLQKKRIITSVEYVLERKNDNKEINDFLASFQFIRWQSKVFFFWQRRKITFCKEKLTFVQEDNRELIDILFESFQSSLDKEDQKYSGNKKHAEAFYVLLKKSTVTTKYWFLVKLEKKIVGSLLLSPIKEKFLEIDYISVLPAFRGKSLIHKILNFAQNLCIVEKYRGIIAETDQENYPMKSAFIKSDFDITKIKDYFYRYI